MKVLFDIGHPAQVHIFKNVIRGLNERGHETKVIVRERDCATHLLNKYDIGYETIIEEHYHGLLRKALGTPHLVYKSYDILKKFDPDVLISEGPLYSHIACKLLGKHSISFLINESEYGAYLDNIFSPFVDLVCTSTSFEGRIDPRKNTQYNGYLHLTYLHPDYFKPDDTVLRELEIDKNEKFFILRFKKYDATHDIGQHGFSFDKFRFIKKLEHYGKVFVSSHGGLSRDLKKYELRLPPEKLQDAIYFANTYIGDGFSTATESAILGTPAILVSTIKRGYINELRDKYGLVYTCKDDEEALRIFSQLQEDKRLKEKWRMKKEKMLSEKIDVTAFIIDLIENYPQSVEKIKSARGG
ncbi:MAG: DUF354 domain-containing protein [Thermoplasmata archaeon]